MYCFIRMQKLWLLHFHSMCHSNFVVLSFLGETGADLPKIHRIILSWLNLKLSLAVISQLLLTFFVASFPILITILNLSLLLTLSDLNLSLMCNSQQNMIIIILRRNLTVISNWEAKQVVWTVYKLLEFYLQENIFQGKLVSTFIFGHRRWHDILLILAFRHFRTWLNNVSEKLSRFRNFYSWNDNRNRSYKLICKFIQIIYLIPNWFLLRHLEKIFLQETVYL